MEKKIGVIGAGLSGLAVIKELKEEGLDVVCYEKNSDIGGVFSKGGTYDSVELTVSNYFMSYSDFMPYHDTVRFWTRGEYKKYLDQYVEYFDILKNIVFNSAISEIREIKGKYVFTVEGPDRTYSSEEFDSIVVCSGQFQKPNIPSIAGLESFEGEVLHSTDYVNAERCDSLAGKKVLCLGMGESAADIVTEISKISKKTVLSLRRHHVFSSKHVGKNMPIDVMQTRYWHSIPASQKAAKVRGIWSRAIDTTHQESTRLLAKHIIAASDEPGSVVTKTERIFQAAAEGMEIDVGGIKKISKRFVEFYSGRKEEFDAIVFCTGFKFSLPFLSEEKQFDDIRDCYLQAFHPSLGANIAFIGFARPQQGGVPLIAEMQARYLAKVLSEQITLPNNLEELAQRDKAIWKQEFYDTPHVFGLVNGFRFNEHIAGLLGCKPPVPNPIVSPNKFFVYWFHQVWPCQFRLVGPGSRASAKKNWTLAPTVYSNQEKVKMLSKLSLCFQLFRCWMQSKQRKEYLLRWRPIFRRNL